jgi:23S rRNA (cytidine1920-2'-O)/16S rRNA (cytidine1409-2'-O)-methyltransferase
MRADVFLVEQGYAKSRSEAQAAIKAGRVFVDGGQVLKASQPLSASMRIDYAPAHPYVSRGALKLAAALDHFGLSPEGLSCLDLGASTGGFTQILLERGAGRVFAVDVGHGQLHPQIAADKRVVSLERRNARDLEPGDLAGPVQAIVADVSFISLKLAMPPALEMAAPGAWLVALLKPQFEAGRENIGKGGVVRDPQAHEDVLREWIGWLDAQAGWALIATMESPIRGGDGNKEFLVAARKT